METASAWYRKRHISPVQFMNTFSLGPFSIQAAHVMLVLSLLVAAGAGRFVGRSEKVSIVPVLLDMTLAGIVAARLAFVVTWFAQYRAAPLSMLDIRDGGFVPWAGLAAAFAVGVWRAAGQRRLREPLTVGVIAGVAAWFISGAPAMLEVQSGRGIPAVMVTTLDGATVALPALAGGKPAVVNLWASWCPPCIREMPVFASAQRRETGITFIFANQGESAALVAAFLRQHALQMHNVVRDPTSATARAVGSSGTPTTLFFDARGQMVDAHLGPLSDASLAAKLAKIRTTRP